MIGKIGLINCAGCKSQNKDIAVFEEMIQYLMNQGASAANGNTVYDYIVCLCGCGCRCASVSGYYYMKKVFWVDRGIDRETFEKIRKEIEK